MRGSMINYLKTAFAMLKISIGVTALSFFITSVFFEYGLELKNRDTFYIIALASSLGYGMAALISSGLESLSEVK